jgi:perosamine synthetase
MPHDPDLASDVRPRRGTGGRGGDALRAVRPGRAGPRLRAFAAATGAQSAVATSSGTTALFLALLAHGVGPGDEVITSPLTFIATANAICQTGATPMFADVDETLNMSVGAAERLIGPRTRAVVPVHLHGNPCDLVALDDLATRHGLAMGPGRLSGGRRRRRGQAAGQLRHRPCTRSTRRRT